MISALNHCQVSFENPQCPPDSIRTNSGPMSRALIVHEADIRTGTKESLAKLIGRANKDREASFVDLLYIRDRTVVRVMGCVVKLPLFTGGDVLLNGFQDPCVERVRVQRRLHNLGVPGLGRLATDNADLDHGHRWMAVLEAGNAQSVPVSNCSR